MLKFSYLSTSDDAVFAAATMHTQKDPLAPIGLLFQGCQGVCVVANIPDDAYQKLVHAIDQAFGIDHKHVGGGLLMAITAIQAAPASGMTLDIGRIAPVPDRLKYAPSNGAQYLDYLRMRVEELDAPPAWKKLPPDYDRQCYDAHCSLRRHAVYLIEVGVR